MHPHASRMSPHPAPWAASCAGALLGAVIGMLLFAPARWLSAAVERASAERVQWQHVGGRVWDGYGQLALRDGASALQTSTLPGIVRWSIRPQWDGLAVSLSADCCTPAPLQLMLNIGWDGTSLALSDGTSQWPAELLSGLGARWNTERPQGRLRLHSQQLRLLLAHGRWQLAGTLQLDAMDMSTRLSPLVPIGSYRLRVTGGAINTVELSTIRGSLELSGHGQWVHDTLRFQGQAQAAAGFEETLGNLLNVIGTRQGAQSRISLG